MNTPGPTADGALLEADDDAARLAEAARFLSAVFAELTPGEIVIVPLRDGRPQRQTGHATPAAAARAAMKAEARGCDVYFALARNIAGTHDTAGAPALTVAWADLDAEADTDEARAKLLEQLEGFDPAPSAIVRSASGFHVYWLLYAPAPAAEVEAVNVALAAALGSDARMHTGADAILRVPGTTGFRSHSRTYQPERRIALVRCNPAVRYSLAELLERLEAPTPTDAVVVRPSRALRETLPDLLDAVADNLAVQRRGEDGQLEVRCPFHDDRVASAVVFPNGWYFCQACGVNESPFAWTRRPEVREWAERFVFRGTGGRFKFPDLAWRAGWALLPADPSRCRRPADLLQLADGPGGADLDQLGREVRRCVGPLGFRLLAFGIAASQYQRRDERLRGIFGPRVGEFWFNARRAAEALGYSGNVGGARLRMINGAVRGLARVLAAFKIRFRGHGENAGQWRELTFTGPLVQPVEFIRASLPGGLSRHGSVWRLHSGIVFGIERGQCYALADPRALALHDEDAFALYLHLARELRQRGGRLEAPLSDLLRRAGVPCGDLARTRGGHPTRTLERWRGRLRRELLDRGLLGALDVDREGVVHVKAAADVRLPAPPAAWTARAPNMDSAGALDGQVGRPRAPFQCRTGGGPGIDRRVGRTGVGRSAPVRSPSGPPAPPEGAREAARPERTPSPARSPFGWVEDGPAAGARPVTTHDSPNAAPVQTTIPGEPDAPVPVLDDQARERERQAAAEQRAEHDARRQQPIPTGDHREHTQATAHGRGPASRTPGPGARTAGCGARGRARPAEGRPAGGGRPARGDLRADGGGGPRAARRHDPREQPRRVRG